MAILKRWTGGLWTPAKNVLYWTGAAWKERCMKYWNGSSWKVAATKELWVDDYVKGLWHFNENAGTSSLDFSGNGNTCNWGGYAAAERPSWTTGNNGSCLYFDGADRARIADSVDWDFGAGSWTVECWMKTSVKVSPLGNNQVVFGAYHNGGNSSWWLGPRRTSGYAELSLVNNAGGDMGGILSTYNICDNVFNYVVGVVDRAAGKSRLYVNGYERGNATLSGNLDTCRPIDVGWYDVTTIGQPWNTYCYTGKTEDIRISKGIARSAAEILSVWQANN